MYNNTYNCTSLHSLCSRCILITILNSYLGKVPACTVYVTMVHVTLCISSYADSDITSKVP